MSSRWEFDALPVSLAVLLTFVLGPMLLLAFFAAVLKKKIGVEDRLEI